MNTGAKRKLPVGRRSALGLAEVTAPSSRKSRLSEPFQSAHKKCARHRMHHLPPQIRALMGRQIAVRGVHTRGPVPTLPDCLLGHLSVHPLHVPGTVGWTYGCAKWMGTEQARVLVCLYVK